MSFHKHVCNMEPARFSGNDLLQTILRGESCKDLKNPAKNRSTFSHITAFQECSMKLWQDRDRRDQERDNRFVRMCAVDMYTDVFTASVICFFFDPPHDLCQFHLHHVL